MAVYTTLIEAKQHLRVDFTDDDTYIAALQDMVEEYVLNEIQGKVKGVGTVSTVGTKALVGVDTLFTDFAVGDNILVAGETSRVIETITDDTHLTVTVVFTNTASDKTFTMYSGMPLVSGVLPKQLKQAMLLMIGHFYMLREPVTIGVQVNKIPFGFDALIAPFKYWTCV
jgi:hypothetical protein